MAKKGKGHKDHDPSGPGEGAPRLPVRSAQGDADERAFLAEYDANDFPRPSLTVDVALVTAAGGSLYALLLRREQHPEAGKWALPGGFVRLDESLDEAAARVLRDKANLSGVFLEQLYTFGAPDRDPRTRVVTVAYYALVPIDRIVRAGVPGGAWQLARLRVPWEAEAGGAVDALGDAGDPLPVAFDHAEILGTVVKRLRGKLDYAPIGFELLPETFSLRSLQQIHETISGRRLNKDSFRRRIIASGHLDATGEHRTDVDHRPPELFRVVRPTV